MHFNKKKTYTMDTTLAGETLQNIFAACQVTSNHVAFNRILLNQRPKTRAYAIGKRIALVMLLLTFISPLFFPHSPVRLNQTASATSNLSLESNYVINGNLYLCFYGEDLDPQKCYMITESGFHFTPTSYDENKNIISFPHEHESANIYIESRDGTILHFLLSLKED